MVNKVNNLGQLFRQKEIKAQLSQKKAGEESIDFWRERCANEQYKVFVIDEKKAIKVKHHKKLEALRFNVVSQDRKYLEFQRF